MMQNAMTIIPDASDKAGDAKPEKVRSRPENKEVHQALQANKSCPNALKSLSP